MEKAIVTPAPVTDTEFCWTSEEYSIQCKCRLRIFHLSFGRHLVIISALPNHPGTSFAASLLYAIYQITSDFNLPLNKTMWIEHYPALNSQDQDFFYHLLVAFHNLFWFPIDSFRLNLVLQESIAQ